MRFEGQTITVRDQYQVAHPLPAMVGVQEDGMPTGLVYHLGIRSMTHDPIGYEGWYNLTHLASGLCVSWDPSVRDEHETGYILIKNPKWRSPREQ